MPRRDGAKCRPIIRSDRNPPLPGPGGARNPETDARDQIEPDVLPRRRPGREVLRCPWARQEIPLVAVSTVRWQDLRVEPGFGIGNGREFDQPGAVVVGLWRDEPEGVDPHESVPLGDVEHQLDVLVVAAHVGRDRLRLWSPPTEQVQANRARDFSGINSATTTLTSTVSPIFTGARKFKVCEI